MAAVSVTRPRSQVARPAGVCAARSTLPAAGGEGGRLPRRLAAEGPALDVLTLTAWEDQASRRDYVITGDHRTTTLWG